MIMCTFKHMLAVTNRRLCPGSFMEQVTWLAMQHPAGMILREKDLNEEEYEALAAQVRSVCQKYQVSCILHTWIDAAKRLECGEIHLPLPILRQRAGELEGFIRIGASVHSVEEAKEAVELGATYLSAGHIFPTDCKAGIPARGLSYLKEICQQVERPVYGIGGITPENASSVLAQGAAGYCVMSGIMKTKEWSD